MQPLKLLSFGAGAVGTYIGGSLAWKGHQLAFVERAGAALELRERGLRIDFGKYADPGTEPLVIPPAQISVFSSLEAALDAGPYDVALFALKSFDTQTVLDEIQPHAALIPPVLCLQNGVENEGKIALALGEDKVIAGSITSAVGRRAVGDIILDKYRGVGLGAGHPLSQSLFRAFDEAFLNPRLFARAADMKWSKMLGNQLTSAVAAILDMTPEEVLADNGLYELEMAQLGETLAVMKALGIRAIDLPGARTGILALAVGLPRPLVQPLLKKLGGDSRGEKAPSLQIDLHNGRRESEVDDIHGAVVRAGDRMGLPTPVNRVLTETLLALTRGEIPQSEYARQPEKLLSLVAAALPSRQPDQD